MKNSAGRTEMGAVMGSKNLKAVAIKGSLDIRISDPEKYLKYYLNTLKKLMKTKWVQALGKYNGIKGEGPEYASIGSLGTKLGNLDLENIILATELCNRYGLDTSMNLPILCNQCKGMKCLDGEDVMERTEKKKFVWDKKRAERCPFDALTVFGENAYHCDLCTGSPQCVKVCTPKAIRI
jgi:hypothetical protein